MDLVVTSQKSTKIGQFPAQNHAKVDTNWNNGFGFDGQNLIIKLAKNEWKSMKNEWKLNEILAQFDLKINEIW